MTLIETKIQKSKEFNPQKQDHGDAAEQQGHLKHSPFYEERTRQKRDKKYAEHFQVELNDDGTIHESMTVAQREAQLEAEADKLLGITTEKGPALLKASDELLRSVVDTAQEGEVADLLDQYEALHTERAQLLDTLMDDDTLSAIDTQAKIKAIEIQLESIEGEVIDTVQYAQDNFATEAELGIKTKHEFVRAMARRVTQDVSYEDDDDGDSDYHVPVRIKNRL
jgi:hypothetical protein